MPIQKRYNKHLCSKEAEIATMAEKLNHITRKVDDIDKKMDHFIETADTKYATKKELESAINTLDKDLQDTRSNVSKLTDTIAKWAPTITLLSYFAAKTIGWLP
jgi:predicted RNase H-like nuclease (RuvC/YqgF family)